MWKIFIQDKQTIMESFADVWFKLNGQETFLKSVLTHDRQDEILTVVLQKKTESWSISLDAQW